jgi:hypothetical protein
VDHEAEVEAIPEEAFIVEALINLTALPLFHKIPLRSHPCFTNRMGGVL